jgi:hypothetical protein
VCRSNRVAIKKKNHCSASETQPVGVPASHRLANFGDHAKEARAAGFQFNAYNKVFWMNEELVYSIADYLL